MLALLLHPGVNTVLMDADNKDRLPCGQAQQIWLIRTSIVIGQCSTTVQQGLLSRVELDMAEGWRGGEERVKGRKGEREGER